MNSKRLWLRAGFSLTLLAATASAQTFQYNHSDLLIGFRRSGAPELVINAGPVTNYTRLASGQSLTIASATAGFLNNSVGALNDLSWSAFACVYFNTLSAGSSNYPNKTLWVTKARSDLNTQSEPWVTLGTTSAGAVASDIDGFGGNAVFYGGNGAVPAGVDHNSPTGLILPGGDPTYSVSGCLGPNNNFRQTFEGNPEQTTSSTFTDDGQPIRSDLYLLTPGNAGTAGVYLGFFEFSTNGVLKYTAGPSTSVVPAPVITSITRNGNVTSITFTTVSGGTYTLLGSTLFDAPLAGWATIGSPASGTGSPVTLTDTDSTAAKFYLIKAQ
jgi:hypothetical protein